MQLDFCNEQIALLPSGGCYLPDHGALVVSDLHLGKGVLLQDGGVPLTDDFDAPTMAKLVADIAAVSPTRCVITGDLFHANSRSMGGYADQVNEWLGSLPTQVILTIGNHDDARLMKSLTHVSCTERVRLGGVVCQHEPHDDLGVPCIVGHIHPGVKVKKGRITKMKKAFAMNRSTLICPAYGHSTGMVAMGPEWDCITI